MEEFLLVRKIKIIGRNAIERCAPSRSQKHEPNKRFQTSKGVFERRTSTGITCNHAFLLPFVWEAERKVSSPFPSADLHPFCEERTPHRRLQPEVSPFPFKYTLTLPNRPLPNSEDPHFQNEARCTTFLVKMSFICMRMKNDFHIKG